MPGASTGPGDRAAAGALTRWVLTIGLVTAGAGALLAVPCECPQSPAVVLQSGGPPAAQVGPPGPTPTANAVPWGTAAPGTLASTPTPTAPGPAALLLPGLGRRARAAVVPVTADNGGNLAVPDDPQVLGWWSSSAAPEDHTGTVVIDGHVDSDRYGIGFFVNLRRLHRGAPIVLEDGSGRRSRWRVTGSRDYPSTALPYDQVFSQDPGLRLVLITCGGRFDRTAHAYADNLIVYAVPERTTGTTRS